MSEEELNRQLNRGQAPDLKDLDESIYVRLVNAEAWIKELEKNSEERRAKIQALKELVKVQAEDEGLWFEAENIVEAFFQQELRLLHAAIEDL